MTAAASGDGRGGSRGEPCVLAVDLGTGGPKVAVVGDSGRIVAHATEPVPLHLLDGGGAEQDPEEWWSAIRRAAARALAEAASTRPT